MRERPLSDSLEFTGERFTPECVREIHYEHVHRYAFARELVWGRRVLDAASGEGYGSALLAEAALSVTGVDLAREAVAHAGQRYRAPNLEFRHADCLDLPFDDDAFDVVVSFETLEHLAEHDRLLAEFRRVLSPQGFLLLSTPDKAVYTDRMGNRNEFHVAELYRAEFESLLARHFGAHRLWGQKLGFQSSIWSLAPGQGVRHSQQIGESVATGEAPAHEPVYLLAFCADEESNLPRADFTLSLFDDADETVYRHYHHEIRKNMAAGKLLAQRDRRIDELEQALSTASTPWWRRWFGKR